MDNRLIFRYPLETPNIESGDAKSVQLFRPFGEWKVVEPTDQTVVGKDGVTQEGSPARAVVVPG